MGNMGGEGNHLIADTSNGACMKLGAWELLDFVEFFGKVTGAGEGKGKGRGKTFIPLSGQS